MNLDKYTAGSVKEQYEYESFTPCTVNHAWSWSDPRINILLSEADRRLGELNGLSLIVPDLDRFIRMHVVKEAQTSSRIEGTQTGMDEAVRDDPAEIAPEKRDDWQEVRNYILAMNQAIGDLKELPLSNRLLCQTHETLLSGTRGELKTPGEFRRSQNWIGGSSLKDAVFIPPHHDDLPLLLNDLESFWHNESIQVPHLIRIAISHYQFETIHPFLDGNGRIGRLLITLYLVDKKLLQHPCLYLSSHLEKNRSAYYDALSHVRTTNDLGHWLRFFLVAVIETAKQAIETFRAIFQLRNSTVELLAGYGRAAPNATRIVEFLYQKPFTSSQELQKRLSLSRATCDRLITQLERDGILMEYTGRQRYRQYVFADYYNLFL